MIFVGARSFRDKDLRRNRTVEHSHSSQLGKGIALVFGQSGGMRRRGVASNVSLARKVGVLGRNGPDELAVTVLERRRQRETWRETQPVTSLRPRLYDQLIPSRPVHVYSQPFGRVGSIREEAHEKANSQQRWVDLLNRTGSS